MLKLMQAYSYEIYNIFCKAIELLIRFPGTCEDFLEKTLDI